MGLQCWAFRNDHIRNTRVAETCIFRWMYGNHINKENSERGYLNEVGLAPIESKKKTKSLHWVGHMNCRVEDAPNKVVVGWDMGDI